MKLSQFFSGLVLLAVYQFSYAQLSDVNRATLAAAASLQTVLQEIASQFQQQTGASLRIAYASSGNLYRQIMQGAPFELFVSADEQYVQSLIDANKTLDTGQVYAIGRIVLFSPHGSKLKVDAKASDLQTALNDGRLQRLAIANPEHAPYGRAARQALQALGLWQQIQPHLVLGENVAQAAQFASSGSTQGGIIAQSLALNLSDKGDYVILPAQLHQPLRQRMVLLDNAGTTAQKFYTYMQQNAAQKVFERYGFELPSQ